MNKKLIILLTSIVLVILIIFSCSLDNLETKISEKRVKLEKENSSVELFLNEDGIFNMTGLTAISDNQDNDQIKNLFKKYSNKQNGFDVIGFYKEYIKNDKVPDEIIDLNNQLQIAKEMGDDSEIDNNEKKEILFNEDNQNSSSRRINGEGSAYCCDPMTRNEWTTLYESLRYDYVWPCRTGSCSIKDKYDGIFTVFVDAECYRGDGCERMKVRIRYEKSGWHTGPWAEIPEGYHADLYLLSTRNRWVKMEALEADGFGYHFAAEKW